MIGSVAAVVGGLGEIARLTYDLLNQSDKERYDELVKNAAGDCRQFADCLLDDNWDYVQLLFDGLQHGIKVDLTATDYRDLKRTTVGERLDNLDVLGLYCRARAAQLEKTLIELSHRANLKDS